MIAIGTAIVVFLVALVLAVVYGSIKGWGEW